MILGVWGLGGPGIFCHNCMVAGYCGHSGPRASVAGVWAVTCRREYCMVANPPIRQEKYVGQVLLR